MSEQYKCNKCGDVIDVGELMCSECGIGKFERLHWEKGGNGSHWEGCEEVHWDCKIAQLEKEIERLAERLHDEIGQTELANDAANRWRDTALQLSTYCGEARAELARLQEERRWIPVSERLPKYGKPSLTIYHTKNATSQITIRCLVEDRDDKLRVIWYDIENGLWVNGNNITHWMPLPEPPEEK